MNATVFTNLKVTGGFEAPGALALVKLGSVKFNTDGIATGAKIGTLKKGQTLAGMYCVVTAAFNAGTSNAVVIGTADDDDAFMGADDISEGAAGTNYKAVISAASADTDIKVKYTQSGTAASAGAADVYALLATL